MSNKRAFTLIELLVVIAIIAVPINITNLHFQEFISHFRTRITSQELKQLKLS